MAISVKNTNYPSSKNGDGNDAIYGGPGNDVIIGGNKDDTLRGEAGTDLIFGDIGTLESISGGILSAFSSPQYDGGKDFIYLSYF